METVIPLVIVFALLLQAVCYARVVFLRRHLMLPLVERFLKRTDASQVQKRLATDAFQDALSVSLPVNLLRAHRAQGKLNALRDDDPENEEMMAICMEKTAANDALSEIIYVMFKLNLKFNTPLHFVCFLFRAEWKELPEAQMVQAVQDQFGSVYVDLKHQHQHV